MRQPARSLPLILALLTAGILTAQTPPTPAPAAPPAGKPAESEAPPNLSEGTPVADKFNDQATGKDVPCTGGTVVVGYDSEPKLLDSILDNSAVTQYICSYIEDLTVEHRMEEPFDYWPRLAEKMCVEDLVLKTDGKEVIGKLTETPAGVTVAPPEIQKAGVEPGVPVEIPKDQIKEIRLGSVITLRLRKNVKWHDGAPCDIKDVEFTFKLVKLPELEQPHISSYYTDLNRYELLDDLTIRFTYEKQYWEALAVAGNNFYILPKHIFNPNGEMEKDPKAWAEGFKKHPQHTEPIGTGPYKFVKGSWKRNVQLELERNPDYFLPEKAGHLDRIIFRFKPDYVSMLQAMRSGEIDFMTRLLPEQYWSETNNPEFVNANAKGLYYYPYMGYVGWNMRKAPFNDKMVRKALAMAAIDLPSFNKTVLHNRGIIITGPQYCFGPAYNHDVKPLAYNPEKADELLMEAGWYDHDGDGIRDKDGQAFKFEFLMPETSPTAPAAQRAAIMQNNFKKLGIEMTVKQLEWSVFIENIEKLHFDACTLAWALNIEGDPFQIWHSSCTGEQGSNHVGFANPEADKLIEESRTLVDPEKRRTVFKKLHALIYEEQPYYFLYTVPEYVAYKKKFRGVKLYPVRPGYDLTEWYIPKGLQQ